MEFRFSGVKSGSREEEVEVTRADGQQVDVQLDRDFAVVSSSGFDKK